MDPVMVRKGMQFKVANMASCQSRGFKPVSLVLLVLLIVDSAHFFTDDACHIMHEISVPCGGQSYGLRKEGGLLCVVPWHPHAMQALCKMQAHTSVCQS